MTTIIEWLRHNAILMRSHPSGSKVVRVGSAVYSTLCLLLTPGLLALLIFWVLQKPSLVPHGVGTQDLTAMQGSSVYVDRSVTFTTDTNKASYTLWLEDTTGNITYQYPSVVLNDPKVLSLGGYKLELPKYLASGEYILRAKVRYELNPVKTAETVVDLARVRVFPKSDAP